MRQLQLDGTVTTGWDSYNWIGQLQLDGTATTGWNSSINNNTETEYHEIRSFSSMGQNDIKT